MLYSKFIIIIPTKSNSVQITFVWFNGLGQAQQSIRETGTANLNKTISLYYGKESNF